MSDTMSSNLIVATISKKYNHMQHSVKFKTNLDGYHKFFPATEKYYEGVNILLDDFIEFSDHADVLRLKTLPIRLQVKSRTWRTSKLSGLYLEVELYFSEKDIALYTAISDTPLLERAAAL